MFADSVYSELMLLDMLQEMVPPQSRSTLHEYQYH